MNIRPLLSQGHRSISSMACALARRLQHILASPSGDIARSSHLVWRQAAQIFHDDVVRLVNALVAGLVTMAMLRGVAVFVS
jgi:hypothetical protein